eukprot:jgi/Chlat1/2431/Chrsp17S00183
MGSMAAAAAAAALVVRGPACVASSSYAVRASFSARVKAAPLPSSLLLRSAGRVRRLAGGSSVGGRVVPSGAQASVATPTEQQQASPGEFAEKSKSDVRVRFAPSPTGNLHVGGARTALFNWLYARKTGGKLVLRIEDTDQARSTRESEETVVRDLKWLGLDWDEGPDRPGDCGPYRQSERTHIYKEYVDKLMASGHVYRCFCTDEELEEMRNVAEANHQAPKYSGKWNKASAEEVEAELAKDTPHTFRFRVGADRDITINDIVRSQVTWNTDTLGDFIIMRSNGLPVYNFCVAVDDATMGITHVIRAEEHLPNTLRQVLVYEALGIKPPTFAHASLILAPDKSKLSKRHGATSVGEFNNQGFLPQAMVNYLALLGWNDGSEQEIFSVAEIVERFSLDRISQSPAVFDTAKLTWMNGQHLKLLPEDALHTMFGEQWLAAGLINSATSDFVPAAAALFQAGIDLVPQGDQALVDIAAYHLQATLESDGAQEFVKDGLAAFAQALIAEYESGNLMDASMDHDKFKAFAKTLGKATGRKGKKLWMPMRICLTGRMQGPELVELLPALKLAEDTQVFTEQAGFVPLSQRMQILRDWAASSA